MRTSSALLETTTQRTTTAVEIVVPVYNEEAALEESIRRLHAYLSERLPLAWRITIADNASIDGTWGIACRLARDLDYVGALHLDQKGRGRALRAAWQRSGAQVVAYMDVDLSTDLDALFPLVAPLLSGHSDVAIGTRLAPQSNVVRGAKREAISRSYNLLLRTALHAGFSDAQCGFKALRTDVAQVLLPLVEDNGWFFDTELLVLAEHNHFRIHEVPVDWVDDPDSHVNIVSTAKADLAGVWRMMRRIAKGEAEVGPLDLSARIRRQADARLGSQLVRFASIGLVSTVVFAVLFGLLVGPAGVFGADVLALSVCAVANTAANRRFTFALRGGEDRGRHYASGLVLVVAPLLVNLGALAAIGALGVHSLGSRIAVLTAVNGVAAIARFSALRGWVFRQ